jgi:outer membrane protein TolC
MLMWMVAAPAWGREVSLDEALSYASANRSARAVERQEAVARATLGGARSAFDPTLSASTELSAVDSAGFVAGFPTEASSIGSDSSVSIGATTSTGTTWELGADLGYQNMTTLASFGGEPTEQVQTNWSGLVDLTLSQDLLAPFRQSDSAVAARQAGERLGSAELATLQARQDAVVTIAQAWWTWSSAVRLADTAERALGEAVALEAQTQARFDEGDVARLEVSRTRSARIGAAQDLLVAQVDVRAAADQLLLAMGEPPGQAIEPVGDGAVAGGETDPERSLARALEANPDVVIARADVAIAESALRDARRAALPELTAAGSVGMGSLSSDALGALQDLATEDGLPRWAAGLDLSVPLGGRAARSERSGAEAELDIAKLTLASVEEQLRADVRAAVDAVVAGRAAVELAWAQLEVAEETEAGEQARVDEGESRLDDLIAARNARLDAVAAVVAAESDRARAELQLLRLEGRLGGTDGV